MFNSLENEEYHFDFDGKGTSQPPVPGVMVSKS